MIGSGGSGLLCLMVARAAGAARRIAIDPSEYARRNALRLEATHAVDPPGEDPKRRVYEILPAGPDLVVEAAGPIEAVRLMVDLRRRGCSWGRIGDFGFFAPFCASRALRGAGDVLVSAFGAITCACCEVNLHLTRLGDG